MGIQLQNKYLAEITKVARNRRSQLVAIKYLYSIFITFLAYKTIRNLDYLWASLVELVVIIAVTTALIALDNKILSITGRILHIALLLIYNVQTLVMYFGGSYATLVMVTNLHSVEALRGKYVQYLMLIVPMLLVTLIPAKRFEIKRELSFALLMIAVSAEVFVTLMLSAGYSPTANAYQLFSDWNRYYRTNKSITGSDASEFYKTKIENHFEKPAALPQKPNVILIFMEGLSEHIVLDERDIMPNLRAFREEGLRFENYYNHTFATYRGLSGQLYSGYQYSDFDKNPMVSLQSVLKQQGYHTTFINTEPENEDFTAYLNDFGFDEVVTGGLDEKGHIQDKDAYRLLFDVAEKQHTSRKPFFTAIYSFGTHVSVNSPDVVYGDGSNFLLNRFKNADHWMGEFLNEFRSSALYDDTILVFTTDHATYVDEDYFRSFPENARQDAALDRIPLYIFYNGIEPEVIDVNGRNSLDLAPTILDFLDVSRPNYFLGTSLFAPVTDEFRCDFIHHYLSTYLKTTGGTIDALTKEEYQEFSSLVQRYYGARKTADVVEQGPEEDGYVTAEVSSDCNVMSIALDTLNYYENVRFAVWSTNNGQDDLAWYQAAQYDEGSWRVDIELAKHEDRGEYAIHVYAGKDAPGEKINSTYVYVENYPTYSVTFDVYEDGGVATLAIHGVKDCTDVVFPVWSVEDGQDDLVWYQPEQTSDGTWESEVDISKHCSTLEGKLVIHIYGKREPQGKYEFLTERIRTLVR